MQSLRACLIFTQDLSKKFRMESENLAKPHNLIAAGLCFPLFERKDNGTQTIIIRTDRLDLEFYTLIDFANAISYVIN